MCTSLLSPGSLLAPAHARTETRGYLSVEARCVAMEATLLRHDLLQSEVEALEGRLRAAKDFVGVANTNARGYTTMMSSEQVPNSEVGSLRPQGRRFLDELRLDQHLLTQRLVDEENERMAGSE